MNNCVESDSDDEKFIQKNLSLSEDKYNKEFI